MLKKRSASLAMVIAAFLFVEPTRAQPSNGLYQIISGRYRECCGVAGAFIYPLPYSSQAFVELRIDSQSQSVRLTFLGQDMQTIFQIPPLGPRPGFIFSLSNGMVFPDHIEFGGASSPPAPGQPPLSYTVSNSANALQISGTLTLPCLTCVDIPTQFMHTNVVATWVPAAPVIEGLERDGPLLRFRFTGEPPYDYFVEFSESLPAAQWLSLTNYRAKLQTIEAVVTDSLTNGPTRFYRIRKEDCQCD